MNYNDLLKNFKSNPRDIHTFPLTGKKPSWFYCYVEDEKLYVDAPKNHTPACQIKSSREINKNEFDAMFDLYNRRLKGESVSVEATETTVNKVYWYAIIADTLKEKRYIN